MTTNSNGPGVGHPHAHDDLLTMTEVAELLRTHVATLRYWRHLGTGPRSFKVGRHVVYRHGEVVLWLTEQANRPQGPRSTQRAVTPTNRRTPEGG